MSSMYRTFLEAIVKCNREISTSYYLDYLRIEEIVSRRRKVLEWGMKRYQKTEKEVAEDLFCRITRPEVGVQDV